MGHFDALHVALVDYEKKQNKKTVRAEINEKIVEKLNGDYNIRNVVCVTYDDTKDDAFWEEAERMPFLFVSLVNISHVESNMIEKLLRYNNNQPHVMAYYTYDYSEIAVISVAESYKQGFRRVPLLFNKMKIFKMYTVFAVREDILDDCKNVHEESIDCRLYAAVKNWDKIIEFKRKLAKDLEKEENDIKIYDTLGNIDCLIEIPQVSIKKMLCCYKMGRLLTHTDECYEKTFFNIESQFLVGERENG